MNRIFFRTALLSAIVSGMLLSCGQSDVVATYARKSFGAMLDALPENALTTDADAAWVIHSPAGDRFRMSRDFSRGADFSFDLDAAPFIDAGLDASRLPADTDALTYRVTGKRLVMDFEFGSLFTNSGTDASPEATFSGFISAYRLRVGYHKALDHYGIDLGAGHMFEWAKDLRTNDKDIVFVLDPEPFVKAGIDPTRVKGWIFAKVQTEDKSGRKIYADKLLHPFNLK